MKGFSIVLKHTLSSHARVGDTSLLRTRNQGFSRAWGSRLLFTKGNLWGDLYASVTFENSGSHEGLCRGLSPPECVVKVLCLRLTLHHLPSCPLPLLEPSSLGSVSFRLSLCSPWAQCGQREWSSWLVHIVQGCSVCWEFKTNNKIDCKSVCFLLSPCRQF